MYFIELNMETVTLCQNALPRGIDEALLGTI